jgi:HEPN domain-containing protein
MAQDWGNWIGMAERELADARTALAAGLHQMVAFFSHQIAEAALKAVWIHEADRLPPRTHNLVDMAQHLEAPERVLSAARLLNPLYGATRYPDLANGNPTDNYDEAIAGDALARAEEVYQWCSRRLRS